MATAIRRHCAMCNSPLDTNSYHLADHLVSALHKIKLRPRVKARDMGYTKVEYTCYTKLKYWGLIERLTEDEHGESGWQITAKGRQFLLNEIKVPKTVEYFRDRVVAFSGPEVGIYDIFPDHECRQKYREMMQTWKGTYAQGQA
jgi:hypothetical protein